TPTTLKARLRTCSACPITSSTGRTTTPPVKASKAASGSEWNSSNSGANSRKQPHLKKSLTPANLIKTGKLRPALFDVAGRIEELPMATTPRSVHTTAARRGRQRISRGQVSELLDLQKSAHRISSTLDLDELID